MPVTRWIRRSMLSAIVLSAAATLFAQAPQTTKPFEPLVGQPGKDVVWVPTPQSLVDKMLDMAQVTPADFLVDLGSGDGRTVITAARRGARAMGVEFNPDMVALSVKNAADAGLTSRATFVNGDLFETDFSQATVVTMFLLPDINLRLRPTLLAMKPGTRIVSNSFTMGDWEPDETARAEGDCNAWCMALFWVIPANVEGTWRLGQGEVSLTQQFQMLSGMLQSGASATQIRGRLRGSDITFTAGATTYTGRVDGATMRGTMSGGQTGEWTASRRN